MVLLLLLIVPNSSNNGGDLQKDHQNYFERDFIFFKFKNVCCCPLPYFHIFIFTLQNDHKHSKL